MDRSLEIFNEVKNLQLMNKEDIIHLPVNFIVNYASESIDAAWNKLPVQFKYNHDVLRCIKCRVHDHSDKRVSPMIKNCIECMINSPIYNEKYYEK